MQEPTLIEYKVRPITRYIVTRYENWPPNPGGKASSTQHGTFDDPTTAHLVAYALCKQEHQRLGWPIGDMRIQYPQEVEGVDTSAVAQMLKG